MTFKSYRVLIFSIFGILFLLLSPASSSSAKSAWLFDGQRVIRAKVAQDGKSRARGLMYQVWILPNTGMLFVFDQPAAVSFWMKNTLLPLDMRFYDRFGHVLAHYPYAMPCTKNPCSLYPATGKAAYVLETQATFRATPWTPPPLQLLFVD